MAQAGAVKVMDRPDASALGEMVNAELSNQIATAKKHPRDENAALKSLEQLATRSDEIAELCMYTLKRTDKDGTIVYITGPSIRFMELVAYCWGNMRIGSRIVEEGEKTVTAQGIAYDLQRNNGLMVEIKRGITTSKGYRFGQDMINVTSNAACSIAERNAIEDCIPRILWWDVYERVKAKAIGAAQIPEKLQQAVKFFVSKGAKQEDILVALGVKAIEDMGREHLEIFYGLRTALKEGSIDATKIFTPEGAEQRARLSLTDDDPDTESYNSIDKQVAPKESADPKAGAEALGDGGVSSRDDKPKGTRGKKQAGSPPAADAGPKTDANRTQQAGESEPKPATEDDGASQVEADSAAEDEKLLAEIESRLDPAKAMSSRKVVNEHRGALNMIAAEGSEAHQARAKKILTDWPAK